MLDLVDLVYDAIVERQDPAPLVDELGRRLGIPLGITDRTLDVASIEQHWSGLPASFERAYVGEYHKTDPWVPRADLLEVGKLRDGSQLVADAELHATPFYQELCRPFGFTGLTGGVLHRSPTRLISIAAMHPRGTDAGVAFREQVQPLVPHLVRAYRVRSQMFGSHRELVSRFADPAFLFDGRGQLLACNAAGGELAESATLPTPAEGIRRCLSSGPWEERVMHGARPVLVLYDRPSLADHRVLVRFIDPSRGAASDSFAPTLRRAYRLTPAEVALAGKLAEGLTPKEAADALGVAIGTVRVQLRSIFEKTGTDRQVTLTRLLERLRAARGG